MRPSFSWLGFLNLPSLFVSVAGWKWLILGKRNVRYHLRPAVDVA
jgi:hypothetical protein